MLRLVVLVFVLGSTVLGVPASSFSCRRSRPALASLTVASQSITLHGFRWRGIDRPLSNLDAPVCRLDGCKHEDGFIAVTSIDVGSQLGSLASLAHRNGAMALVAIAPAGELQPNPPGDGESPAIPVMVVEHSSAATRLLRMSESREGLVHAALHTVASHHLRYSLDGHCALVSAGTMMSVTWDMIRPPTVSPVKPSRHLLPSSASSPPPPPPLPNAATTMPSTLIGMSKPLIETELDIAIVHSSSDQSSSKTTTTTTTTATLTSSPPLVNPSLGGNHLPRRPSPQRMQERLQRTHLAVVTSVLAASPPRVSTVTSSTSRTGGVSPMLEIGRRRIVVGGGGGGSSHNGGNLLRSASMFGMAVDAIVASSSEILQQPGADHRDYDDDNMVVLCLRAPWAICAIALVVATVVALGVMTVAFRGGNYSYYFYNNEQQQLSQQHSSMQQQAEDEKHLGMV